MVMTEIVIERNLLIPMSDGVRLAADLYRPKNGGPFPATGHPGFTSVGIPVAAICSIPCPIGPQMFGAACPRLAPYN